MIVVKWKYTHMERLWMARTSKHLLFYLSCLKVSWKDILFVVCQDNNYITKLEDRWWWTRAGWCNQQLVWCEWKGKMLTMKWLIVEWVVWECIIPVIGIHPVVKEIRRVKKCESGGITVVWSLSACLWIVFVFQNINRLMNVSKMHDSSGRNSSCCWRD